ncbi:MAG: DUF115 domain-containing protein [Candidatus Thorarchaeota archaeon]|nr:DUF115 domain-containing protein [Candidatus Thorarchaeota archaeon]
MIGWDEWRPVYFDIVKKLNLDTSKDYEATLLLSELLKDVDSSPLLDGLQKKIHGNIVVVCGAGPSLQSHIQSIKSHSRFDELVIIAADGAVSALMEQEIHCDFIATDLDGKIEHIIEASEMGTISIVHAHGDNIDRVKRYVPILRSVLGSTQVEPCENVFLWGGFTDGDRACHIVSDYSPREIILAGMDFGDIVGKWSKPSHDEHFLADRRKKIKLEIAQGLVSQLFQRTNIPHTIMD